MSKQHTKPQGRQFIGRSIALSAVFALALAGVFAFGDKPAEAADITVYKSPACGCCGAWVDHLKRNGFEVTVLDRLDMQPIKDRLGVPERLRSCHTAEVGGYLVEGHVPAESIRRLLAEKPAVQGLAVPGMPMGSPGMEGPRKDPYSVVGFTEEGELSTFKRYNQ